MLLGSVTKASRRMRAFALGALEDVEPERPSQQVGPGTIGVWAARDLGVVG